jgi:hypothetical protein
MKIKKERRKKKKEKAFNAKPSGLWPHAPSL